MTQPLIRTNSIDPNHYGKIPPQAPDMEQAVLASMLIEPQAIIEIADILKPEHFYVSAHQTVYKSLLEMYSKGLVIDLLTVAEYMRKHGEIELVGGVYFLTDLSNKACSSVHIQSHAMAIVEKWMRRQMIADSYEISREAFDDSCDVFDLAQEAEKKIFSITNVGSMSGPQQVHSILVKFMERCKAMEAGDMSKAGVPSGYRCIDSKIRAFANSDLILLAARPGMGKTAFAVGSAIEIARAGIPVLIFSLEMSAQAIIARMLSYMTEIKLDKILASDLDPVEWQKINSAVDEYDKLPIYIDESCNSPIQIASKSRRAKMRHGIGIIMIDYLQIIPYSEKGRSRNDDISFISGSLKRLAKELNVPVLALAQLSRDVEKRGGGKRPMLSDLRDSGSLEQDADMVIFLYRDEYYGVTADEEGNSTQGKAEFIIAKYRNGKTQIIDIGFKGHCTKYHDISAENNNGYKF